MGKRGPKPTPTNILKMRGSWRAGANPDEPQPESGAPDCPVSLSEESRIVWASVCEHLEPTGILTRVDGGQLERYATYLVRWRQCEAHIAKHGISYPVLAEFPKTYIGLDQVSGDFIVGYEEWPEVAESHRLDADLKRIEACFGMTPSDRARIVAPTKKVEPEGKAKFFA